MSQHSRIRVRAQKQEDRQIPHPYGIGQEEFMDFWREYSQI
jgi:hypothetical protein